MQKAAVQAQRVATGTLGPVAAGPQQLLEKTRIKHIQQLAAMVKAPHLVVTKAAAELALRLARCDRERSERPQGPVNPDSDRNAHVAPEGAERANYRSSGDQSLPQKQGL
ncbi:MAG TPA: hypothetical protein VFJ82_01615 [Longimicrobium sp.]|nr:hypothetical protein [Longimicrobium sp.]